MYFLDSCICIDFMRGKMPNVRDFLYKSDPKLFGIPAIVEAELLTGAARSAKPYQNRFIVETFLEPFASISFDSRCAIEYARIRAYLERKGLKIGANDMLIAATALANGAVLATDNIKEFERVPGLLCENWYEVDFQ